MAFFNFRNIRVYWLAFIAYWGIVLFGYDTGIAGGVVAQNYFLDTFGILHPDGTIDVQKRDKITSDVVSILQAGAFFGALGSAPLSSRFGRKKTLIGFALFFSVGAALQTSLGNGHGLSYLYAGRVIAGVGIGGISAVSPTFVSECSPKNVRGRITGLFQIMVAVGVMLSYFMNLGASLHLATSNKVWRVPLAFQFVPAGIMTLGLLTVKESPRWLASRGRSQEALVNLAYFRNLTPNSPSVRSELAEIEAQIKEERQARVGLGLREAFLGKGNFIRFVIAFIIFLLQQFCGQNSVNYYAPRIFQSIGYRGVSQSLLASGIYGIIKVVATTIFVFTMVESLGRKVCLFISAMGMGVLLFIVGALLKVYPPPTGGATISTTPPASKAMAAMLYIFVCFYSIGWGPLPWVYSSDIFPTRTRHFGLSTASASQWLWNFVISYNTPRMVTKLGWKLFIMFATVNVGALATFSLLIPETKGRSLEEMDIIFGSVDEESRRSAILKQEEILALQAIHGSYERRSLEVNLLEGLKRKQTA